ncbi:helix-turn-helix domain-containing protein [Coleofasciculus sp.]|uniref:helix-turn-helix domain-containing protein n=1 Tax=Coleofasciculus sp. TaxID=3100458 RepID=UPI0039F84571
MAYKLSQSCTGCDTCRSQCPTGAIKIKDNQTWIDPNLCNNCEGYYPEPQCVIHCPISSPVPSQGKKGRYKLNERPPTSPDLFANDKTNPFASSIVIWEACNLLAQGLSLLWHTDASGKLCYQRQVSHGKCKVDFCLTDTFDTDSTEALSADKAQATLEAMDIKATCLHLIYAAYATALEKPWQEEFTLNDVQIENYLGLEKRTDLSKAAKLSLIKQLAQQPCKISIGAHWSKQGKVPEFSIPQSRLWHLQPIEHHFQEDEQGYKHLVGLTFRVRAGIWAKYFLNRQGCQNRTAFYQYGNLPQSLLSAVMSNWQHHEGATRMMLWLLFKTRIGKRQRITVPTLMRVAYGEDKLLRASSQRDERKRLVRTFETDLEVLSHYGLKPVFDPVTYLPEIQPMWAKLGDLPDDADAALEFWIQDGNSKRRLTDAAPRGKWNLLMKARILWFELKAEWEHALTTVEPNKVRLTKRKTKSHSSPVLSGADIIAARKHNQLSQRDLAQLTGKSQSWIRDIEKGRFQIKLEDQRLLQKVLGLAELNSG